MGRAFCLIAANHIPTHDAPERLPTSTWQLLGNDAILVEFNEALWELTGGAICRALGMASSDSMPLPIHALLMACACDGRTRICESVRQYECGTYRLLALYRREGGCVVECLALLERLECVVR